MTSTKIRSELAARSRVLPRGHPELEKLRQKYRGELLRERVETMITDWSPLSNEQLDAIVGLLTAARKFDA